MRLLENDPGFQEMLRQERGLAKQLEDVDARFRETFSPGPDGMIQIRSDNVDRYVALLVEKGKLESAHLEVGRSIWRLKSNWKD